MTRTAVSAPAPEPERPPDLSRLDMDMGAWATFRLRYGWGAHVRIQATLMDGGGWETLMRALVRETVTGWHVPTETGGWQDWTPSPDAPVLPDAQMDACDSHAGDLVLNRCDDIWNEWKKGRPDPKGTGSSSPSSPTG